MPRARLLPTAAARMRGVLRRPFSVSQLCVVRVPWTTTGSPLLTLPETLPDRSFQHSTSTQKVPASTNSWVWGSKRRAVEARRKLVTVPFSRLTRRGEAPTLPTTVTCVSFTVLLRGCPPDRRQPAWCRCTDDP